MWKLRFVNVRKAIQHNQKRWGHSTTIVPEEYEREWTKFFANVNEIFELQRGLNNCFGYDIVPTQAVLEEAIKASRRVNDFGSSVRILAGLRDKVENMGQYKIYCQALAPLCKSLGVPFPEDIQV